MESFNTFSAPDMDLPRITPILPSILSDPKTGMRRGGIRGIRDILNTGVILSDSILIGAGTRLVTSMTRIFITSTIAARGEVGIKDSRVIVPQGPPVPDIMAREQPVRAMAAQEPPVPDIVLPELPAPDIIPKEPPVRAIVAQEPRVLNIALPELPVQAIIPKEPPLAIMALQPPLPDIILPGPP